MKSVTLASVELPTGAPSSKSSMRGGVDTRGIFTLLAALALGTPQITKMAHARKTSSLVERYTCIGSIDRRMPENTRQELDPIADKTLVSCRNAAGRCLLVAIFRLRLS